MQISDEEGRTDSYLEEEGASAKLVSGVEAHICTPAGAWVCSVPGVSCTDADVPVLNKTSVMMWEYLAVRLSMFLIPRQKPVSVFLCTELQM